MERLREKSRRLRAKLSTGFDDLLHKMKKLAEQKFSPKTTLEEFKKRWDESDPDLDFEMSLDRGAAKPKIFVDISPRPLHFLKTPVVSSTPIRPRLISRGNQTLDLHSVTSYDDLSLDDIQKFHQPWNQLPIPDPSAFKLVKPDVYEQGSSQAADHNKMRVQFCDRGRGVVVDNQPSVAARYQNVDNRHQMAADRHVVSADHVTRYPDSADRNVVSRDHVGRYPNAAERQSNFTDHVDRYCMAVDGHLIPGSLVVRIQRSDRRWRDMYMSS